MRALIFDFDGVIADSEALANLVLARAVSAQGLPTTLDQALNRYMGKRWPEVLRLIEQEVGKMLPPDFSSNLKMATLETLRSELREVKGASVFIRKFSFIRRCIASSSFQGRLQVCLDALGLRNEFGDHVYSADEVEQGKPHPDIFLFAAQKMEIDPKDCVVIEDSSSGVKAARAAGMMVVGLCAGTHIRPGHAEMLKAAGAHFTAESWEELSAWIEPRMSGNRQKL
jgi:HAD superfamily hydrolase (TIGR01549 family)